MSPALPPMPLSESSGPARGRSFPLAGLAALAAVLGGLLYVNALQNPFVYDDYHLIVENESILNLRNLSGVVSQDMTRPLVSLSYAVDAAIWGRRPFGFHFTSVLLHMLNVGLVLYMAVLVTEDRRRQRDQVLPATASPRVIAMTTALLFATHPLMTQAVGYISGRSEVLHASLFLLAFLAARRWMMRGGRRWWLAAACLWTLALLAKETAIMFGLVPLCYDRLVLDGDVEERRRRWLRFHLPLLSMAVVWGLVRVAVLTEVEYPGQAQPDWRFAIVALGVPWHYLRLLAIPRGQSIFHEVRAIDDPLAAVAVVVGLMVFLAAVWRFRRVHSAVAFGCFWFFLLLVPSGVLFTLGRGEPMAEHRVYGASIGAFLAVGSAFGMLAQRIDRRGPLLRRLLYGVSVFFVLQLCGRTIIRNAVWGDPVTLSREAVGLSPDHWMPRLLLGEALRTTGRCGEAIPEYRMAVSLYPQGEFGYTKLAACLIEAGRTGDAAAVFEQLQTVNPGSPDASTGLGVLALLRNRPIEGRAHFRRTLEIDPADSQGRQLLAFLDGTLDLEETAAICAELERLSPSMPLYDGCATGGRPAPPR